MVVAGLLAAAGLRPPPRMPKDVQLDWEAILSATPSAFIAGHCRWLHEGVWEAPADPLASLEPPVKAFRTLRDRMAALVAPSPAQ